MIALKIPRRLLVASTALLCATSGCEKKTNAEKPAAPALEKPSDLPGEQPHPLMLEATASTVAVQLPENVSAAVEQTATAALGTDALVERVENGFGYAILLPKGARELSKDDSSHTFSLILPDGDNEINVTISRLEAASLADAINTATMFGANDVLEQRDMDGGGYFIVKGPRLGLQEVWAFRHGRKQPVAAKCTGPASNIAILRAICASLRLIQ